MPFACPAGRYRASPPYEVPGRSAEEHFPWGPRGQRGRLMSLYEITNSFHRGAAIRLNAFRDPARITVFGSAFCLRPQRNAPTYAPRPRSNVTGGNHHGTFTSEGRRVQEAGFGNHRNGRLPGHALCSGETEREGRYYAGHPDWPRPATTSWRSSTSLPSDGFKAPGSTPSTTTATRSSCRPKSSTESTNRGT